MCRFGTFESTPAIFHRVESVMDIMMMMGAARLAPAVAKYLGIIEDKLATIEAKVDRLGKSEFEAGVRALIQAGESEGEAVSLLREARNRFNQAIGLESGVRLIHAYLGLALSHQHLGDTPNAISALKSLIAAPTPEASSLAVTAKAVNDHTAVVEKLPGWAVIVAPVFVLGPVLAARMASQAGMPAYNRWLAEKNYINAVKEKAKAYLQENAGDIPGKPE